ncbi:MAG: hypothetical protein IT340_19885 [Chloroflexi bacterium]|nr:hypothetical protein [Chloroflexota bacterium]
MVATALPATAEPVRTLFDIPEANLDALATVLAKLNKKATKYGTPPIAWSVGAPVDHPIRNAITGEVERVHRTYPVTIIGEAPRVGPWAFIAKLAVVDGGTLVSTVPGEACPVEYRHGDATRCDHCHTARHRTETFVVRHAVTGEHKQVGRNCLQDFLGGLSPQAAAAALEYLHDALTAATDAEGYTHGSHGEERYPLAAFLAYVAVAIRRQGWVSRTTARDSDRLATADVVLDHYYNLRKFGTLASFLQSGGYADGWLAPEERDAAEAGAAVAWLPGYLAAQPQPLSDYLHNLSLLVGDNASVTRKEAGLAASIVSLYQREQAHLVTQAALDAARREQAAASQHVGVIGQRLPVTTVTITSLRYLDGLYGVTVVHGLVDEHGNVLTWFASGGRELGEVGGTAAITATVKDHTVYRDVPQTIITRVKEVQPMLPLPTAPEQARHAV